MLSVFTVNIQEDAKEHQKASPDISADKNTVRQERCTSVTETQKQWAQTYIWGKRREEGRKGEKRRWGSLSMTRRIGRG